MYAPFASLTAHKARKLLLAKGEGKSRNYVPRILRPIEIVNQFVNDVLSILCFILICLLVFILIRCSAVVKPHSHSMVAQNNFNDETANRSAITPFMEKDDGIITAASILPPAHVLLSFGQVYNIPLSNAKKETRLAWLPLQVLANRSHPWTPFYAKTLGQLHREVFASQKVANFTPDRK
jgi:hypothetical protein